MAQTVVINLSRPSQGAVQPWGFRLQGGLDFASPLTVLKVNPGSLAEGAGLKAGDTILRVNQVDVPRLRHQEALDAIAAAGNQVQLLVGRAGIWKPQVTPLDQPVQTPGGEVLMTKTSLALRHEESSRIGSGHNSKATPFSPSLRYDEKTIKETISSQSEVLPQGVVGVNFKKNEKIYDSAKSEVFKMLQEMDKEPKEEELLAEEGAAVPYESHQSVVYESTSHTSTSKTHTSVKESSSSSLTTSSNFQQATPQPIWQQQPTMSPKVPPSSPAAPVAAPTFGTGPAPSSGISGVRSVAPPTVAPKSFKGPEPPAATADNPRCGECDRLIVGVFVRLKDKNLHVECFRCATCGTSLKNVGYYRVNNKLYCDIHAKSVAQVNPPAPDMRPITVSPGAPAPKGAVTTEAAKQLNASLTAMSLTSHGPPPPGGVRIFPPPPQRH